MDLASRPDPLDDLLPQVAALAEVERLRLIRFLGKKALADVFAVTGLAVLQTDDASRFGIRELGAGRFQARDQRGLFGGGHEDEESRAAGGVEPRD